MNALIKHATTADSATTAGTATNVSAGEGTADAARHVWFSDSTTETKRAYSDKFKYNPVTNNLTVNVTGMLRLQVVSHGVTLQRNLLPMLLLRIIIMIQLLLLSTQVNSLEQLILQGFPMEH